ncbi:MAG TPA: hypothetical protein PL033_14350 [Candidatus Brocadiia bacterium]|nr:hypothetical protein [Candidatus Brocadiia bacterium]
MATPDDRKYSKTHEWVKVLDNSEALLGVSHNVVNRLGYVVHIDLPDAEDEIVMDIPFGMIESMQEVAKLMPPVDAVVLAANDDLYSDMDALGADPYGTGWLIKIRLLDMKQMDNLMTAKEYDRYMKSTAEGGK